MFEEETGKVTYCSIKSSISKYRNIILILHMCKIADIHIIQLNKGVQMQKKIFFKYA